MASLNKVFLVGNLTKDPEVKYLPDGTAVADLRLAINDSFRSRSTGEVVEQTCFVDVVVWRKPAEACGKYLSKGAPVLVEGRLHLDEWKAQDGTNRTRLRVRALRVQFLSAPRGNEISGTDEGNEADVGIHAAPTADNQFAEQPAPASADTDNLGDDDNLPF